MKEWGFRLLVCTFRLNWSSWTSWGWLNQSEDTAFQKQDSKFEPWWSADEHATFCSWGLTQHLTNIRLDVSCVLVWSVLDVKSADELLIADLLLLQRHTHNTDIDGSSKLPHYWWRNTRCFPTRSRRKHAFNNTASKQEWLPKHTGVTLVVKLAQEVKGSRFRINRQYH